MRISTQQRSGIHHTLRRYFGPEVRIWLFGSRTDDNRRGGDVDLYVETELEPGMEKFMKKIEAGAALEDIFDGAKVDLIVRFAHEPEQAIHRIAKKKGAPMTPPDHDTLTLLRNGLEKVQK